MSIRTIEPPISVYYSMSIMAIIPYSMSIIAVVMSVSYSVSVMEIISMISVSHNP